MKKDDKRAIKEVAKLITSEDSQVNTPTSGRQAYVDKMGNALMLGEMTLEDIARDLYLTEKQLNFCKYFTSGEYQADGVNAMIAAYGYEHDNPRHRSLAYKYIKQYLTPNHSCSTLISVILYGMGLNPSTLDKELYFVVMQNFDMKAKTIAIREANLVLGRTNKKILEVNITQKLDFSGLSDKKLEQFIKIAEEIDIKDDTII